MPHHFHFVQFTTSSIYFLLPGYRVSWEHTLGGVGVVKDHEVCKVCESPLIHGRLGICGADVVLRWFRELEQDLVPEWRAKYLNYKVC